MIVLAVLGANLPFLNERLFAVVSLQLKIKPFWLRLVEWHVFYWVVGGIAYLLESRMGNAFGQKWEFYAITVFLFLVLAYPGFVFRYLRKRRT